MELSTSMWNGKLSEVFTTSPSESQVRIRARLEVLWEVAHLADLAVLQPLHETRLARLEYLNLKRGTRDHSGMCLDSYRALQRHFAEIAHDGRARHSVRAANARYARLSP